MKSEHDEYMETLLSNDHKKMKNFLLKYGKKPKPISPIYFIPQQEAKDDGK